LFGLNLSGNTTFVEEQQLLMTDVKGSFYNKTWISADQAKEKRIIFTGLSGTYKIDTNRMVVLDDNGNVVENLKVEKKDNNYTVKWYKVEENKSFSFDIDIGWDGGRVKIYHDPWAKQFIADIERSEYPISVNLIEKYRDNWLALLATVIFPKRGLISVAKLPDGSLTHFVRLSSLQFQARIQTPDKIFGVPSTQLVIDLVPLEIEGKDGEYNVLGFPEISINWHLAKWLTVKWAKNRFEETVGLSFTGVVKKNWIINLDIFSRPDRWSGIKSINNIKENVNIQLSVKGPPVFDIDKIFNRKKGEK
jgi:hypothetical protein